MDVTPQELRSSEIKDSWRGYDRDEVDDLLERAAVTIESLTQELQVASSRPAPAAVAPPPAEVPLPSSRDDADMLQRTLLLAQRAADDAVNDAQARSKQMLEESEAKAQALVSDAEATARRIAEGERRRLETELLDLSARREQLRADADALEEYVAGYRDRIRTAIEDDLARLGGEVDPPSARPVLHEVDLPVEREPAPAAVVAAAVEPEAAPDVDPAPEPVPASSVGGDPDWDSGPATRSIGGLDTASDPNPLASVAAPSRPEPTEWPPPAPAAQAPPAPAVQPPPGPTPTPAPAPGSTGDSWLASSDPDWSASSWDAPAPWEREGAYEGVQEGGQTPAPAAYASDVPMEANAIETDSLDDDAFFASLREAARDDAPLGPRDDEQSTFIESGSEQDRRRFRRRR